MDFKSFFFGFVFCMVADVIFSLADYLIAKSRFYRGYRKAQEADK